MTTVDGAIDAFQSEVFQIRKLDPKVFELLRKIVGNGLHVLRPVPLEGRPALIMQWVVKTVEIQFPKRATQFRVVYDVYESNNRRMPFGENELLNSESTASEVFPHVAFDFVTSEAKAAQC